MSLTYIPASVYLDERHGDNVEKLEYPEFFIEHEYLTSVCVSYSYRINNTEHKTWSGTGFVDHPSFKALRECLARLGHINVCNYSVNGDTVTNKFKLNGVKFEEGDRFLSSSAISSYLKKKQMKNLIIALTGLLLLSACGGSRDTSTESVLDIETETIYNNDGTPVRNISVWIDPEYGCQYLFFYRSDMWVPYESAGMTARLDGSGEPICGKE